MAQKIPKLGLMSVVSFSLQNKVALVTGGSKGIGKAIATAFAENGADVCLAARGAEALKMAQDEISKFGHRVHTVQGDMGIEEQVTKMYEETASVLGGVDILVNNAAIGAPPSLSKTTHKDFMAVMDTNVWGPFHLSRLCRQSMIKRKGGTIINIASNEAIRPSRGIGMYSLSKAAMMNMTQLLAKSWARDHIRISTIAPGIVRTVLAEGLVRMIESSGVYPNVQKKIGEPSEIAGLALFLASQAGSFATGMTYVVDGGEVIAGPGDTQN